MVFSRALRAGAASLAIVAAAAPAHAETLGEALAAAFETNPQLDIQRAAADIAREDLALARSSGRPQVSVSATGGYEYVDTTAIFNFGVGERPTASAQIQAVQPIYTGGRIAAGVRAARAGITAADFSLAAARQDLTLDVVTAYVDVRRDREAVAIRKNNVEVTGEQVRAAQDRFDVGVVTRTDVEQARARLEGARAALAGAEATLEGSSAIYTFLTALVPGDLPAPPPVPPIPASLDEAVMTAMANNPTIAAAQQDLVAAGEAITVAKAGGRPQLSLVGTAAVQETFGDSGRRDNSVSALARGSLPLFTGGAVKAQVSAAKLRRDQARRAVDSLETQVRAQVAQAWHGYSASLRAIEASRRQVGAAQIAYDGAKEELAVGVRTTLDVLDQEQQLFEARLALVQTERDAYVAAHRLLRATGALGAAG